MVPDGVFVAARAGPVHEPARLFLRCLKHHTPQG
jgi:hypothetical protein